MPLVVRGVALEMPSVCSRRVDLGANSLVHVIKHVGGAAAYGWQVKVLLIDIGFGRRILNSDYLIGLQVVAIAFE